MTRRAARRRWASKGNIVWTGVRGVADMSTGDAITADTVFDIASASKQFTATAILLLVEAGKTHARRRAIPPHGRSCRRGPPPSPSRS